MDARNSLKASDWEVAGYFAIGAGEVLGAQRVHFTFASKKINARKNFKFIGAGLTVGPLPVGMSASNVGKGSFHPLVVDNPFSLDDMHMTSGRLSSATYGSPVGGYSVCCISAGFYPSLFTSQNIPGQAFGIDIGLDTMVGIWANSGDETYDYRLPGEYYGTGTLPATLDKKRIEEAKRRQQYSYR